MSTVDIVVQLLNLTSVFVDDNADSTALQGFAITTGPKVKYLQGTR